MKTNLYYNSIDEKEYLFEANEYAKKTNSKITKRLGNGAWGVAFLTDKEEVIKITTDPSEALVAHSLVGKELPNIAKIYGLEIKEDIAIIRQEYIETNEQLIKELFDETERKLNLCDQSFSYIDFDELSYYDVKFTHDEMKLMMDITKGNNAINKEFGVVDDFNNENIGFDKNGNYIMFDQRTSLLSPDECLTKLDELKEETMKKNIIKSNLLSKLKSVFKNTL